MEPRRRSRRKRPTERSTPQGRHLPVMLDQVMEILNPRPGQVALDCTLGNAGHATAILQLLGKTGKLIGVDLDAENIAKAKKVLEATGFPFSIRHANFAGLSAILADEGLDGVDLLVADLGMSSMQVDDPQRGFSYVRDGPLDMRMDRSRGLMAAEILNTISEEDLAAALRDLGDETEAGKIARALVVARTTRPFERTTDVTRVISSAVGQPVTRDAGWRLHPSKGQWTVHPAARTFQALRILVNRELANLRNLLRVLPDVLRPNSVAAIIAFHSGEDRLVKAEFRKGLAEGYYEQISPDPLHRLRGRNSIIPGPAPPNSAGPNE